MLKSPSSKKYIFRKKVQNCIETQKFLTFQNFSKNQSFCKNYFLKKTTILDAFCDKIVGVWHDKILYHEFGKIYVKKPEYGMK